MEQKHKFDTLAELLKSLSPYISARALAHCQAMATA